MLNHRLVSAGGTTNATLVNGGYTKLHYIDLVCAAAAAKFLKIYDKASAPTVGTDTPVATFQLVPTGVNGGKNQINLDANPLHLKLGLAYALTGALADNDTTALTAADVVAKVATFIYDSTASRRVCVNYH